ncbi:MULTISPECIES: hypothetical protein [unclassified Spiroplasma]|uniref:hypothetical protein n=1 Tax=unclassified Spiroplasma TaxID=2637901 RepID=UPI00313D21E2
MNGKDKKQQNNNKYEQLKRKWDEDLRLAKIEQQKQIEARKLIRKQKEKLDASFKKIPLEEEQQNLNYCEARNIAEANKIFEEAEQYLSDARIEKEVCQK